MANIPPTEPLDFVPDDVPSNIATPEGDNEYLPDQPLKRDAPVPERPRGNEPHPVQPIRKALG